MSAEMKMRQFLDGWHEITQGDFLMPDACKLPGDSKMMTWEERMEPLSVFECRELGRDQAKRYVELIDGCASEGFGK